jgi:hypothetical protein
MRYRQRLLGAVPDWVGAGTAVSLLTGGFGLSILQVVHVATPTVLFALAAGSTVLSISVLRLVSPMHEGMNPQRRGVDPPSSAEVEGGATRPLRGRR